jgi:ABC-type transport system involved in multi-copper enzyme maturation permease subunit
MITPGEGPGSVSNPMVRVLGTIGACVTLVLLALAGANKISREKEQQTLEGLLTTPLDSAQILFGKWLAAVWTVSPIMVILLLVWGMGMMTGGIHPASLPLLLGAYLVYVCCFSTLGLWLSMASRTTLRATLFSLLSSMVMVMGPGLLMRAIEGHSAHGPNDAPIWYDLIVEYGFTPPLTLWTLTFHGDAVQNDRYAMLRIVAALVGLLFYIGITALMWVSMLRRLRGITADAPRSEGGGG